jgi:hypothetical protein
VDHRSEADEGRVAVQAEARQQRLEGHALDVGGEPVPEATGFEAVMAGARERITDDDALLAEMSNVLDSLYAHFGRDAQRGADKGNSR